MTPQKMEAIRQWVAQTLSDLNAVIFEGRPKDGEPTAGRPDRPYVSLRLGSTDIVGQTGQQMRPVGHPDGDEVLVHIAQMEATVTVRAFGASDFEADSLIEDLRLSSDTVKTDQILGDAGLVLRRTQAVLSTDELRGTHFESQAEWDVVVGYTALLEEDVGVIERATFELDVDTPDRVIIADTDDA